MTEPEPRRFTLVDALVLLAATAVALAGVRGMAMASLREANCLTLAGGIVEVPRAPQEGWTPTEILHYAPHLVCGFGPVFATSWTLGWLALRLRSPRPSRRRLWAQPGAFAALAALLAVFWQAGIESTWLIWFPLAAHGSIGEPAAQVAYQMLSTALDRSPDMAACGIVAGWAALALGGRFRAAPSWLDRLGRVLGMLWIALSLDARWIILQEAFWPTPAILP